MSRLLRSSFGLWAIWASLLLAFLLVGPRPSTLAFWVFLVIIFVAGGLLSRKQRAEASQQQDAFTAWSGRLTASGAIVDVDDDGHLYEWLDAAQWQAVFEALEQLPPGGRSLRQVLATKFPEVLR